MRRFLFSFGCAAVLGDLGCGGNVTITDAGGSGGTGSAGAAGATMTGEGAAGAGGSSTGEGGSAGSSWAADLAGHYMQLYIGNCINAEEWLSFTPPHGAVETFV